MSIAVKTAAGWQVLGPGELPGLGGWAEITSVWDGSGAKPNRYAYNDGSMDWVAFEWTADGELTTQAGGLVDMVLIGPGGGNRTAAPGGAGGQLIYGLNSLNGGTHQVTVEPYSSNSTTQTMIEGPTNLYSGYANCGGNNSFGTYRPSDDDLTAGKGAFFSYITGTKQYYGISEDSSGSRPNNPDYPQGIPARPNKGDGGGFGASSWNRPGTAGCLIVRCPAPQAAGVDPTTYNDVTVRSVVKEKAKEAVKAEVKSRKKTKK